MYGVSYFPVPKALQRYFATLHRAEFRAGEPVTLPAMLGQLWFTTEPMWWVAPGSRGPESLPVPALIGFTSRCFDVSVERDAVLYGCGFWSLGWAELIRIPASKFVDMAVDAQQLWPELPGRWPTLISDAGDDKWGEALCHVAQSIAAGAQPSPDAKRIAIIDEWLDSDGGPGELAHVLGLSPRQVERTTLRTHGGSPRLIAGKWRALRAAAEMELAGAETGKNRARYADQSHLIREFRRFIGSTPEPFRASQSMAKRVVADVWHLDSDHPLALSHRPNETNRHG